MLWVNMIMDTFAALALATEEPYESILQRTLTFANQVASFTVTKKGANPPWLDEIKNFDKKFFKRLKEEY